MVIKQKKKTKQKKNKKTKQKQKNKRIAQWLSKKKKKKRIAQWLETIFPSSFPSKLNSFFFFFKIKKNLLFRIVLFSSLTCTWETREKRSLVYELRKLNNCPKQQCKTH